MLKILKVSLVGVSLVLGATHVSALEGRFDYPTYKRTARLDVCFTYGKYCGQEVADRYCRVQGYQRAVRFETEHASPTRIIANGQTCIGGHCTAFKRIYCYTSAAQRGQGIGWPQPIDNGPNLVPVDE